jgi:hypothetical protein
LTSRSVRAALSVAVALSSACSSARIQRVGAAAIAQPAYTIEPLPDGAALPPGWELQGYSAEGETVHKRDAADVYDLQFAKDPASAHIAIRTQPIRQQDLAQPLESIAAKTMSWFRVDFGYAWVPSGRGDGTSVQRLLPLSMELTTREPPRARALDNADLIEAVFDQRSVAETKPRLRFLVVWARPRGSPLLTTVVYASRPDRFDDSIAEARSFVERIRFR